MVVASILLWKYRHVSNSRRRTPKNRAARSEPVGPRRRGAKSLESALNRKDELLGQVWSDVMDSLPHHVRQTKLVEPQEGGAVLTAARIALEGLGATYAQAMGSYAWLFGLRRVPDNLTSARLTWAGAYNRRVAEALSTFSTAPEDFPAPQSMQHRVPDISKEAAEALVRMCGLAVCLSSVHSALRRAGKGESIQLRRDNLPWSVPDRDLDEAIETYDRRVDVDSGLVSGTRTLRIVPFFVRLDQPVAPHRSIIYVSMLDAKREVPTWSGALAGSPKVRLKTGRFHVSAATVEISSLFESAKYSATWSPSRLSSVVLLLRVLFILAYTTERGLGFSLPTVGYTIIATQTLKDLLQAGIEAINRNELYIGPFGVPESAEVAFNELSDAAPRLWPLAAGPVIRQAGEMSVVDVSSASMLLNDLLTVTNSEPAVLRNARGSDFELYTQSLIDLSPWRPPAPLGKLRGRTLKLGGIAVTDIDAIAIVEDVVILISCKSILHTSDSDSGEYRNVRNIRTLLENADQRWSSVVSRLRDDPIGDNYDFSGYRLVGVVCTPHVEFVLPQQLRAVIGPDKCGNSIRAVSSLSEIMAFIIANESRVEISC